MPSEIPVRQRLLLAIGARPHRYQVLRRCTTLLSLGVLLAVPLLRLARLDLLGGEHWALGRRVDGITALGAVVVAIVGFYLVTFLLNAGLGRVFCGWGCPVAEVVRLGERAALARAPRGRARALAAELLFDAALATSALCWLVSPRVLLHGSARAIAATVGGALLLTATFWVHGRTWRWGFCRKLCPIGLYYSIIQTGHRFGVHFDRALGTCIDCGKCAEVCPVSLEPRDLDRVVEGIGGLAVDGMPARHHCLSCGDCVQSCELVLRRLPLDRVPLRLRR